MQRKRLSLFPVRRTRGRFAAIAEAFVSGLIVFSGIMLLVITLTLTTLFSTPGRAYIETGQFWLRIVLAIAMIAIGCYFITGLLWKVSVSRERRQALVNKAGEIELLNDFRRRREDLPSVPVEPPLHGVVLPFRLMPSGRNFWRLLTSGGMSVMLVTIASILLPTAFAEFSAGSPISIALIFSTLICLAALWFMYRFFRQLLKLTGIGPTSIELSHYPLIPGRSCQVRLLQPSRITIRVLSAWLVCQEEATFDQGTDIRTETRDVFRQRIFRKRSFDVTASEPFETTFEMSIPAGAMHSFKSANNRIRWKIEVQAEAKGWPGLSRTFRLSVHPGIAQEANREKAGSLRR